MTNRHSVFAVLMIASALLTCGSPSLRSQEAGMVPVHMVVTAEARHGGEVTVIRREDVTVYQGRNRAQVTDWVPLQGDRAGLQLFLLLDDASATSLGSQLEDIRQFIVSQPASALIAVGYMHDGTVDTVQNFTGDHALAAKALRLPMGTVGAFASPYLSIQDLLKRWPER